MLKGYRYKHVDYSSHLCMIWLGNKLIFIKDLRINIDLGTWNIGEMWLRMNVTVMFCGQTTRFWLYRCIWSGKGNLRAAGIAIYLILNPPPFNIPTVLLIQQLLHPKVLLSRVNPKHLQATWLVEKSLR